jgi:hypothetical protein
MRKVMIDFYLTVLVPLLAVTIVSLWNSIRFYLSAKHQLSSAENEIKTQIAKGEVQVETAEWRESQINRKDLAKQLMRISFAGAFVLVGFPFLSDAIKLNVMTGAWLILSVIGFLSFLYASIMAWICAQKRQWLNFFLAVCALLITAASTEHFFHQQLNAKQIMCPHCDENDHKDY